MNNNETDMMADMLANSHKVVDDNKIITFGNKGFYSSATPPFDKQKNNKTTQHNALPTIQEEKLNYIQSNDGIYENNIGSAINNTTNATTNYTTNVATNVTTINDDDEILEKLHYMQKLAELQDVGVTLSRNYNLKSDLRSMKFEYELHHKRITKQKYVQFACLIILGVVTALEAFIEKTQPFGIKLTGWKNRVKNDIDDFNDVLRDIYDKYSTMNKNRYSPELYLLLLLFGSACTTIMNKYSDNAKSSKINKKLNDEDIAKVKEMDYVKEKEKEFNIVQNNINDNTNVDIIKKNLAEYSLSESNTASHAIPLNAHHPTMEVIKEENASLSSSSQYSSSSATQKIVNKKKISYEDISFD